MTNSALAAAVQDAITKNNRQFKVEKTGQVFLGIVESDLSRELRDRRWKLPRGWLSEVENLGFKVQQVYQLGDVRTHFDEAPRINPDTGRPYRYDSFQRRLLSKYNTIISL